MFQPLLREKFEYFTRYFESAFKNKKHKIPQSILLYGQDNLAQYYLAQEIARNLNCLNEENKGAPECNCLNCNWIRENRHPAVLTISKNDNKGSEDTTKKVISIKQVQLINSGLINSSEYYRVFIICDSENRALTKFQQDHINDFSSLGFKLPTQMDEGLWYPKPLSREILQSEASNALLKSIEEPPERVLFIFLTEDKEDLLETIVSRSSSFYIPSFLSEKYDTDFLTPILTGFPDIKKDRVLFLTKMFMEAAEERDYEIEYAIDCLQFYFKELIKSNLENPTSVNFLKNAICGLQEAKRKINAYVKPQSVLETFFFSIAK